MARTAKPLETTISIKEAGPRSRGPAFSCLILAGVELAGSADGVLLASVHADRKQEAVGPAIEGVMIRSYQPGDLPRLKEITVICFEGVAIDRNMERLFGEIGDHDWRWRKLRHIDQDVAGAHADGVWVYEDETSHEVMGYITCRVDQGSKVGWIPNMAVLPEAQGRGIGKSLMEKAFAHFRESGMEVAKIETLEQNPVGQVFYPGVGFEEVGRQIHYAKKL